MEREEHRAWRHFEPIPDYRGCKALETLEDFHTGCCEMAPGLKCPYVKYKTHNTTERGEEKLGLHPGTSFLDDCQSKC